MFSEGYLDDWKIHEYVIRHRLSIPHYFMGWPIEHEYGLVMQYMLLYTYYLLKTATIFQNNFKVCFINLYLLYYSYTQLIIIYK